MENIKRLHRLVQSHTKNFDRLLLMLDQNINEWDEEEMSRPFSDRIDYVICCGGAMAAYGLRDTEDMDLIVSEESFDALLELVGESSWSKGAYGGRRLVLFEEVEVFDGYYASDGVLVCSFDELFASAHPITDSIFVADFAHTMMWKMRGGRDKDREDVKRLMKHREEVYFG